MKIKRVGVLSLAKVSACIYAILGFIIGLVFLAGSLVVGSGGSGMLGLFGAGAPIVLPLLYGLMGAVMGAVLAVVYNFIASITGGIEIEVE